MPTLDPEEVDGVVAGVGGFENGLTGLEVSICVLRFFVLLICSDGVKPHRTTTDRDVADVDVLAGWADHAPAARLGAEEAALILADASVIV